MKLLTLTIQNLMSIRKATIELDKQGLMLIQGKNNDDPAFDSNGAGKSTVSESLIWVLFDKTLRGLSGDEVVNRDIGKNTNVVLDFEDDSGSVYRISRYRKHNVNKNACHIFKDGVNITPKSTKDANVMIGEIFGMDFHTFTNSILFGQGAVKMFSTATDKDKKEILEKMLQIEEFKKLLEEAKSRLSAKNLDLSALESNRTKTADLVSEIEQTIASLERAELEENARVELEITELQIELVGATQDLKEHSQGASDHSEQLETLSGLKTKVDEKLNTFKKYEELQSDLLVDERSTTGELNRQNKQLNDFEKEMDNIASGQGTSCPACGQDIQEDTIAQSLRHVAVQALTIKKDIKATLLKLGETRGDLDKVVKALSGKDKLIKQKDHIIGELSSLQASIRQEVNLRKTYESRVSGIEKSIASLTGKLGKTYQPLIDEKSEQLIKLQESLEEEIKTRESLLTEIDDLQFWVEAFGNSGIKSYLLDSVTPFLNKKANEYLSKLSGSTTSIEFSTQSRLANGELRDKFEIRILNSVGGDSYEANSTGERRRIDLAISLALQDLVMSRSNGKLNFLMYDEVFDGLDAVGCENAIQLLQDIQMNVDTIFVITHNDVLKTYFDKYLVVTKESGATTVHKE